MTPTTLRLSARFLALLPVLILVACQSFAPQPSPTAVPTKTPIPTATVTPTPQTQYLMIPQVEAECARLDEQNIPVRVSGVVEIPNIIYGYEGWYGMELVTNNSLRVLIPVGEGNNTMDDLPELFSAKDLVIRDNSGAVIRQGHSIEITGKVKYRAGNVERECEIFVEDIQSRTSPDVLVPIDKRIAELTSLPVEECLVLERGLQVVRVQGEISLDARKSKCSLGTCALLITDESGSMLVNISRGGGRSSMESLPPVPVEEDIRLQDRDGQLVEGSRVMLSGVIHCQIVGCDMIVYEIGSLPQE